MYVYFLRPRFSVSFIVPSKVYQLLHHVLHSFLFSTLCLADCTFHQSCTSVRDHTSSAPTTPASRDNSTATSAMTAATSQMKLAVVSRLLHKASSVMYATTSRTPYLWLTVFHLLKCLIVCLCVEYRPCYHSEFQCRNQQCVLEGFLCDGVADCLDASDEENCGKPS